MLRERLLKGLRIATLAGILAAFAAQGALAQDDVSLAVGRRVAAANCGRCHAVDRRDESPNPKAPRFRTLGEKYPFEGLRQALTDHMIVGHLDMPVMTLAPTDVNDLVAYLKSLQTPRRRAPLLHPAT